MIEDPTESTTSDPDIGIGESSPPPPPEPTPTDPPPPPAPDAPDTIVWEPQTWYSITYACLTDGCPSQNIVLSAPMFYSNNADPKYLRVWDSACKTYAVILTATKLDPQPIEE
ncbi:hypothetical protein ACFW9D_05630 [Streptomyces sp. NPDC059524]|uniref:hypothetical protein n=1 Tax=Streptomyces sp. NPDC059524 TaxID=3346856 RepID=UPI0036937F52